MSSLPEYGIVARDKNFEYHHIKYDEYPAGEPMIKGAPSTIESLIVRPTSFTEFMAAMMFIEASVDHGYDPFNLILPYFPGARQDRINMMGDMLFTARFVARLINSLKNVKEVRILDPHSDVVPALLDRVRVYNADFVVGPTMLFKHDYDGIIAPDAGSTKRAEKVAGLLGVNEVLQGGKIRDVETGKLKTFTLQYTPFVNGKYLVVDDICDGGGTFVGLSEKIKDVGLDADLYITHGIFSQGTSALMEKYGTIYCSDSVLNNRFNGVTVIPTVERMLK